MSQAKAKVWGSVAALVTAVIGGVLAVEKGYVNDPNDRGGETNHGITVAVARQNDYTGPMRDMPVETAKEIYAKKYVYSEQFDRVLAVSPAVGTKMIDIGVNSGPGRAARTFQFALNALSREGRDYPMIDVDTHVGPKTMAAYAALEKRRGRVKACELVIKILDGYQVINYVQWANTGNNSTFVVGWIDHRIGNVPLSRCAESVEAKS